MVAHERIGASAVTLIVICSQNYHQRELRDDLDALAAIAPPGERLEVGDALYRRDLL